VIATFRLRHATLHFRAACALDNVTVDIDHGQIVGFLGPSGAGKTSLLRLLNGSLRPTTGEVIVGEHPLHSLSNTQLRAVRASLGFIHQDLGLIPNLTVAQNVIAGQLGRMSLSASIRAMLWPSAEHLQRIFELLERVGMQDKMFERADRLSGGQRQRVAIARALFQQPIAILADEPVSSLDPARARDLIMLLTQIAHEEAVTLCMSLHNLTLAREFCSRLVGLRHGRIVFDQRAVDVQQSTFEYLYDLAETHAVA
jgi:phosphonate transport system ATP-binding protein